MIDPLSLNLDLVTITPLSESRPKRILLTALGDDDYTMELDYSSVSKYLECPRSWQNYAVFSREAAKDRSATDFGRLFHELEEQRLLNGLTPEVIQRQREMIALHFLQHPVPPTDHRTADMMIDVIAKYNARYATDQWRERTLQIEGSSMVERPFKIPLTTVEVGQSFSVEGKETFVRNIHVVYIGRIDLVLQQGDLIFVVDHKTSSRGGAEFENAFRLSLQTRGYCYAAQILTQLKISGLILNAVIIRPPTRTGKGTEFNRETYFYSQDSLVEWLEEMQHIVTDIIHSMQRNYFPQYARSFKSPCASCDYAENCTLPRNQRANDLASTLYRDVTWSPLD